MDITALVTAIRQDLPNIPPEVAATWIAPHAARPDFGWPPPQDGRAEPWCALLAARPMPWWRERIWVCEELPMVLDYMSNATRLAIDRLLAGDAHQVDILPDSRARIDRLATYIEEHGTWPVAPVAYPASDGLALSDGHHRLAALERARREDMAGLQAHHRIWIALPSGSTSD